MSTVTMAHNHHYPNVRSLLVLFVISTVCVLSVVDAQFFLQRPIRPLFFVHKSLTQNNNNNNNNNQNGQLINLNRGIPQSDEQQKPTEHQTEDGSEETRPFPGNARSDILTSSEEEAENENDSSNTSVEQEDGARHDIGRRRNITQLPGNFDARVRANRPPLEPRPVGPRMGDPAVIVDDEEQDRSRFLWPFQTQVTVTKSKAHPHLHSHPPHHHHHSGPPFTPPLFPPHLSQHHHHKDDHGDLEYEKTRLKYEIYKLKAKKTIAILQNKVELKKILSLLLQQKIKALEYITCYHDYVEQMYAQSQGGGWGGGDDGGDEGWVRPLTDEEILHSKGSDESDEQDDDEDSEDSTPANSPKSRHDLSPQNRHQQQQQNQHQQNMKVKSSSTKSSWTLPKLPSLPSLSSLPSIPSLPSMPALPSLSLGNTGSELLNRLRPSLLLSKSSTPNTKDTKVMNQPPPSHLHSNPRHPPHHQPQHHPRPQPRPSHPRPHPIIYTSNDNRPPMNNNNNHNYVKNPNFPVLPNPYNHQRNKFRIGDIPGTGLNKNDKSHMKNKKKDEDNSEEEILASIKNRKKAAAVKGNTNRRNQGQNKVNKKEKVKKTIYNILLTTMNALDGTKDDKDDEDDEDLKL